MKNLNPRKFKNLEIRNSPVGMGVYSSYFHCRKFNKYTNRDICYACVDNRFCETDYSSSDVEGF